VSSSGSGRVRIGIWFPSIESCKVGVNIEIEVHFSTSWLHDGSEEMSALEVAKDTTSLDSRSGMPLFWI
jgi:hypothetical protein